MTILLFFCTNPNTNWRPAPLFVYRYPDTDGRSVLILSKRAASLAGEQSGTNPRLSLRVSGEGLPGKIEKADDDGRGLTLQLPPFLQGALSQGLLRISQLVPPNPGPQAQV